MNGDEVLDPVVERTRQAREALARQCGYDVDRLMDLFKSMQAEHPERVRRPASTPSPRPECPEAEAI
jgi:hypothetical protein